MDATATSPDLLKRPAHTEALGLKLFAVAFLAALAVAAPNIIDPMIRFDDYPALFAEPSYFWTKTLSEGRWVNYLWHLRGVETPAWANFVLYQMFWAAFAAAVACAFCRDRDDLWFGGVLAIIIVVAPPATMISLWYNTLIPGLGLVALYAVLGARLPQGQLRALMPLFVVLGFMAYTTYPLLILLVALVYTQDRSMRDLIGLLALFALSFVGALLVVYSVNYAVHGVFGIELADWRKATPGADAASLLRNLSVTWDSFSTFGLRSSYNFVPTLIFHLTALALATGVLLRHARQEATYLWAGLVMGLLLVVAQTLKTGAVVPNRGFIFAWAFYGVIVVRAAMILNQRVGAARLARNGICLIAGLYAVQTFLQYTSYRDWQAQTRAIASHLGPGPVMLTGDVRDLASAQKAHVQDPLGFHFRMRQLKGQDVIICQTSECGGQGGTVINVEGAPGQAVVSLRKTSSENGPVSD